MTMSYMEVAKFCHYLLYFLSFIGLLVPCYVLYMKDAIKESKNGAITITKRSEAIQYEPPTIIFCPKPDFKHSISKKYNLSIPIRDIFSQSYWFQNLDMGWLQKTNVIELYDEFQLAKELTFVFYGHDLNFGKNEIYHRGETINVELKQVPTAYSGVCCIMHFEKSKHWSGKWGHIYVGYNQGRDGQYL